jgi:hypothetical protein
MEKRFSGNATKVFLECGAGGENTGKENHLFLPFLVFLPPAPHPLHSPNAFLPFFRKFFHKSLHFHGDMKGTTVMWQGPDIGFESRSKLWY